MRTIVLFFLLSFAGNAFAGSSTIAHGISLLGQPKYNSDFKHFDYVNAEAPKGGVLSQAVQRSFDSFNSFIPRGLSPSNIEIIYDSLLVHSADELYSAYGLLAETIELPDDRSWVAFNLRDEARFHDGVPITADDVVFSFELLQKHGSPQYRQTYESVESVQATGKYRVLYRFKSAGQRKLPFLIGQLPVFPRHFWTAQDRDFSASSLEVPLGSGPYRVDSYKVGQKITYRRVADYWGRSLPVNRGRNNFDQLVFETYRDLSVSLEAFKAGAYNCRFELSSKDWYSNYNFPALATGDVVRSRIKVKNNSGMNSLVMNIRRPVLQDPLVREALILAFDFNWINEHLMYGEYDRTTSYFHGSEFAATGLPDRKELQLLNPFKAELPGELFTRVPEIPSTDGSGNNRKNLNRAVRLLKQAGYEMKQGKMVSGKTGKPLVIGLLNNFPQIEQILLPYRKSLASIGVELQMKTVDNSQYTRRLRAFDYDLVNWAFGHERVPGEELYNQYGSAVVDQEGGLNLIGISSPLVDSLIARTETVNSREELQTVLHALDRVLLWGHYVIPKWYQEKGARVAHRKEIRHRNIEGLNWLDLNSWWYQED